MCTAPPNKLILAITILLIAGCENVPVVDRAPIETRRPNLDILTIGHRGGEKFAPENTLPSIEKAIELGFDYVELDVRYTSDGVPVLMHDYSVDRTTNGTGGVASLSLDEIRKLDAGSWFSAEFAGTKVPLLEEALAIMQGKICIYWDTKAFPDEATLALFKRYGFDRNCMLISAGGLGGSQDRGKTPEWLIEQWPTAPLLPYVRKAEDIAPILNEYPNILAVHALRWHITEELVNTAHAAGLLVSSAVHDRSDRPEGYEKLISRGVNIIMLTNKDLLDPFLNDLKQKQQGNSE